MYVKYNLRKKQILRLFENQTGPEVSGGYRAHCKEMLFLVSLKLEWLSVAGN